MNCSGSPYRSYIEGNLHRGDGMVILTNATRGDDLIAEIRLAIDAAIGWRHRPAGGYRYD